MAGEWIKMAVGLRTHPKVVRMATMLKADRLRVVGGLHAVWGLFDTHSVGGKLDGYTAEVLDADLGWKGFTAAMVSVQWLEETTEGIAAPDYEEHNGPNAKRRAMETSRKGRARKASADCPHDDSEQCGQVSASDADNMRNREEKRREEEEPNTSLLSQAPAFPPESRPADLPQLALVEAPKPKARTVPDCPHQAVLALWAECLASMPQHNPAMWRGARADHLRARWRETAVAEGWETEAEGLGYFRRLFGYIARSAFLTGRAKSSDGRPPFVAELAWIVCPENWAKVHEGKYHTTEVA